MKHAIPCLLPSSSAWRSRDARGTEDYLGDLQEVYDRSGAPRCGPRSTTRGQLVHEAFAGLSEQKVLTLSQMARAVAALRLDRRDGRARWFPCSRPRRSPMLARLALRYPIPPVAEPYEHTERAEVSELVAAQIAILGEHQERLGVPAQIALLNSPDHAVVEKAVDRLRDDHRPDVRQERRARWENGGTASGRRGAPRPRPRATGR